jgi:hypothetical protein
VLREYLDESGMVTGIWRKLHKEELHNLYCSSNINHYDDRIKEHEWGRETEHKLAGETAHAQ